MLGQKNITHIVVGKDDDLATSSETRDNLVAGQIGVFKEGSLTATTSALSAGERFKVVFKDVDGNIIESPFVSYDNIISKNAVLYSADSEQKTYVGYNGTTGSIAVSNSDEYYIHLDRKDSSKQFSEHALYKLVAAYKSGASATQTEIVDALVVNAYKNLFVEKQRSGRWVTKVGRINSAAVDAANDFLGDATVVKGTKSFTVAESGATDDAGVYNASDDIAVGDYVRIGGVGDGTALTSNVYKVTAVSGVGDAVATITVDVEILEASGTYAAGTSDIEVIPSADIDDWGIMFESQPVKFVPGLFKNQQVTFNVGLSDAFDSTLVTEATSPAKGNGTYEEVAEIEQFLSGNRGEPFRVASYPVSKNLNATSGEVYDTINVQFTNNNSTDLDSDVKSWIGLVIFTEDESSGTPHTDLKTVLGIS